MKSILQITKSAGNQLIRIANEHKCQYILFYVNGGGCNGFKYNFEPTRDPLQRRMSLWYMRQSKSLLMNPVYSIY